MRNNLNNQITVASLVVENVPSELGRVRAGISRCTKSAMPLLVAVASSALAYGICFGATQRDSSQCTGPVVGAGMLMVIVGGLVNSLRNFNSETNQISIASLVQSTNSALAVDGIPFYGGSPSAPELNSASGAHSPRSSLYLERGGVFTQNTTNPINQNNVNADLVFPINR